MRKFCECMGENCLVWLFFSVFVLFGYATAPEHDGISTLDIVTLFLALGTAFALICNEVVHVPNFFDSDDVKVLQRTVTILFIAVLSFVLGDFILRLM